MCPQCHCLASLFPIVTCIILSQKPSLREVKSRDTLFCIENDLIPIWEA